MDLRHLVAIKQEGEEITGRQGHRSEDSRTLSLREMRMPRMRAGRRWTSQLRAVLAARHRVTQRKRYAQRATVPPWMLHEPIRGLHPHTKAERSAHANTKHRGYAAANLSSLFKLQQRRQHTMQSTFDALGHLMQDADGVQYCKTLHEPLSDAPMLWSEYLVYRQLNQRLAFCAFMVSQFRKSRIRDSETGDFIGKLTAFRPDSDTVATQTLWTHIALWDNNTLGFPGPVEWHFRETDTVETYSKRFTLPQIERILEVSAKLKADATLALEDLEADEEEGECASFLLSETHGVPKHLTTWEAKVWCRHAKHQATALRHACELLIAGRKALYDDYIAKGIAVVRDEKSFDVCEYLGDYMLVARDGDEIISL